MTSIFEGQPPPNKVFSNQNKGHLRFQIYIYINMGVSKNRGTPKMDGL